MKHSGFAIAVALILASCGAPEATVNFDEGDESEVTELVQDGEVLALEVREGDCVDLPDVSDDADTGGVASFELVACDVAHDAEVYELFDLTDADQFPGVAAVEAEAAEGCLDAFEPFIGVAYEESQFFFTFVPPSEGSWEGIGDREVICLVVPAPGEPQLTMSLEGVAS